MYRTIFVTGLNRGIGVVLLFILAAILYRTKRRRKELREHEFARRQSRVPPTYALETVAGEPSHGSQALAFSEKYGYQGRNVERNGMVYSLASSGKKEDVQFKPLRRGEPQSAEPF